MLLSVNGQLNEYLPLKQGLRLSLNTATRPSGSMLNEYLPLKQGLRQFYALIRVVRNSQ